MSSIFDKKNSLKQEHIFGNREHKNEQKLINTLNYFYFKTNKKHQMTI